MKATHLVTLAPALFAQQLINFAQTSGSTEATVAFITTVFGHIAISILALGTHWTRSRNTLKLIRRLNDIAHD